ncbi:phage protein [Clostridium haemolyticum]|uniref:Uncharacterized protein n=1 Tax=Clostridium haemolyticum NCTC 9693 TaxID=1443114 RepID=A0ABR4TIA7_CLOHA|nr:hypothetical protein [Clostridium haemolyticum]KEI18247.1 hypothetical protein Z960_03750 [Clostridium haemolyticum NCTC 9693]KGN04168.1 hypothetical protein Z961_04245 [Clostridium haemolyticum NCTC 8350]
MNEQFKRKAEAIIATRKYNFPDLHMEFNIKFDSDTIPDEGEVSIYNLSPDSIARINKKNGIVLNAGYGDDLGSILDGVITDVETYREGVDTVTKIKALNITWEYLNKPISYTYAPGATTTYLVKDLLQSAGNLKANINNPTNNLTYSRGFQAYGKIIDVLRRVVIESDSRLLVHGPSISVIPKKQGITLGFLLNSKTGLIKVEKIDKNDSVATHKIEMLLNHAIAPYSLIQVESTNLNGTVMVIEGEHKSDFTTEVEVMAL